MPDDPDKKLAQDHSFLENFAWSHRPEKKDPAAIHRGGMDIRVHPLLAIPLAYLRHFRIFLLGSCFAPTLGLLYYCYSKSLFSADSEVQVLTSEFTETTPRIPGLAWDMERMQAKLETTELAERATKRLAKWETWQHGINSIETQPIDTGIPGNHKLAIRVYSHDQILGLKWARALFEEYRKVRSKELKQAVDYIGPKLNEAIGEARQKIMDLERRKEEILGQQKSQDSANTEWDGKMSAQQHKLNQFGEVLKVWNGDALEAPEKIRLASELYDEFYPGEQDVVRVGGNGNGQTISHLRFGQYGTKIFDVWKEVEERLQKWKGLLDDEGNAKAKAQGHVDTLETHISRINSEIQKSLEMDFRALKEETQLLEQQTPPRPEKWKYPLAIEAINHNIQEAVVSYAKLLERRESLESPDNVVGMSFLRVTDNSKGPIHTGYLNLIRVVLVGSFLLGSLLVFQAGTKLYDIVDNESPAPGGGSPDTPPKETIQPETSQPEEILPVPVHKEEIDEDLEVPECPDFPDEDEGQKIEESKDSAKNAPGNTDSF